MIPFKEEGCGVIFPPYHPSAQNMCPCYSVLYFPLSFMLSFFVGYSLDIVQQLYPESFRHCAQNADFFNAASATASFIMYEH